MTPTTPTDGFVSKLNSSLTTLIQSTYLGGSYDEYANSITIDSTSNIYVAGTTTSPDFPGATGGAQAAQGGSMDAFVSKLNPGLTSITQSTYLGGSGYDNEGATSITIDSTGNVYVAGWTMSTNLPGATGGAQAAHGGGWDGFVSGLIPSLRETTAPTVSSTSPANSAINVAVNTAVTATFSEAMDASTINITNFTLSSSGGPVAGTVTYSGTTATFTPSSSLNYSTTYTATITTGVKDLAGNAMAANYSWSFTTTFSIPPVGNVDNSEYSVKRVDGYDLIKLSFAFGSGAGDPRWDSICDLDKTGSSNNFIDGLDLIVLGAHFGEVGQ